MELTEDTGNSNHRRKLVLHHSRNQFPPLKFYIVFLFRCLLPLQKKCLLILHRNIFKSGFMTIDVTVTAPTTYIFLIKWFYGMSSKIVWTECSSIDWTINRLVIYLGRYVLCGTSKRWAYCTIPTLVRPKLLLFSVISLFHYPRGMVGASENIMK